MNKKKINIKKLIIILIILLILIITIFINNSLSKYITEVMGKGYIEVAKWSFLVNGQTSSMTNINLAKTYNKSSITENKIAPGTSGSFDIVIDTRGSDVEVEYNVKFENETKKPSNLYYIYNENIFNNIKDLEPILKGNIKANDEQKIKTLTIHWNWKYETGISQEEIKNNDEKDTEDGILLGNYKFDVIVSGMQIEPNI